MKSNSKSNSVNQYSGNSCKKPYRLIDLFSGAGGLTLGFTDDRFCGGFECVLSLDNDQASINTHNGMFGEKGHCVNIEDWLLDNPNIPPADIVIGGPPCQGFSLLNKKRIGDVRRSLWEPFMDIVYKSGASIFIIENVEGLLRSPEFNAIRKRADKLGFQVVADILNAADYGVAQTRRRTIILGWNRESINTPLQFPPTKTHSQNSIDDRLPDWKTVRNLIEDLPEPVGTEIRDCPPPLNLHFGRTPTHMSVKRYKAVPPGGNRFDLQKNAPAITPKCWIKKKSGGTDLFGRLWWDRPSVTIRTEFFKPEKGRYLHPEKHRPITHREAARLMGFPDDFLFQGSKIEIAKQIGNAVPPPLAGAIAGMVLSMLRTRKKIAA